MKKNKLTTAVIAGLAGVAGVASVGNAVHVNPEGTGQVLIYPYYSLHNGLNTTYSVVNTTAAVKAIKVRFLEGQNSREVLDFNVYLSEYDVWTGVIGPWTSGISGHVGEESGAHASSDNSCAPRLNKSLQEFLPYEIDKDAPNNDLVRSREGHFEVLEMGEVTGAHAGAATHVGGVPSNCQFLTDSWNGGAWAGNPNTDMLPATGGLFGAASIYGVEEGFNVSYDAVAYKTSGLLVHSTTLIRVLCHLTLLTVIQTVLSLMTVLLCQVLGCLVRKLFQQYSCVMKCTMSTTSKPMLTVCFSG